LGTSGFLNLGPAAAYNKYIVESGVRYPQARKYILSEFSQIYKWYIIQIQPFYEVHRKAVFFILLIDNFTVIWFVQCPSHIVYVINCHAKHETEDLQMDIHPGLGVLATGN
jgi:hypothetical protein